MTVNSSCTHKLIVISDVEANQSIWHQFMSIEHAEPKFWMLLLQCNTVRTNFGDHGERFENLLTEICMFPIEDGACSHLLAY